MFLLLEESRARVQHDPDEALHLLPPRPHIAHQRLAHLAQAVATHSLRSPRMVDLLVLSAAAMGNALRAAGDLRSAEKHFGYARMIVTTQGVTDPEVLAQVDDLEGSLRKDQRLFPLAEELLSRASMLYRLAGLKAGVARVLINLADCYFYQGQVERAIETVRMALKRTQPTAEPRLYLSARHNLAAYLVDAGRYHDAADIVAADMGLYREFPDPYTQLRLSWLQGQIAGGLGDEGAAEEAFLTTRTGFIERHLGYDAALVSLDLALLYLRQKRTRELRQLAEETVPIFEAHEIHREAAAALMLFQDAVRHQTASVAMVRELAEYLRAARSDPSLRYREPS